jgi:mannose-6-phosphate isomerase-like protein (cupin superfamily)
MQPVMGCLVSASITTPLMDDVPGDNELTGLCWEKPVSPMASAANSGITRRSIYMRQLIRWCLCFTCLSVAPYGAFAQTPAPAPGSPAIFKSAEELAAALQKATVNAGGMSSSSVTSNDQYRVSLVHRDKPAGALAHAGNTELLYITEGAGTVVTGGTIVPAAAGKPASIANGVTQRFTKGDVIIVPAGSPHWFSVVDAPITYLEVRWLAPK